MKLEKIFREMVEIVAERVIERMHEESACECECECTCAIKRPEKASQQEQRAEKVAQVAKEEHKSVSITLKQMQTAARNVAESIGAARPVVELVKHYAEGSGSTLKDVPPKSYAELLEQLDYLKDDVSEKS